MRSVEFSMSNKISMSDNSRAEAMALLPHILKFSETLSKCTPHGWEARRYLYCTLFVRVAAARKTAIAPIIAEFEEMWEKNPLTLFQLLPDLVDMFGDTTDPDWSSIRSEIRWFYQVHNNQAEPSTYGATKTVPKTFRPLPALYHSVEHDIQKLKASKEERRVAWKELSEELRKLEKSHPGSQCPVPKRYVTRIKMADPTCVWKVKQETFKMIFQRTRELFLFQDEEAHFHHAASILEFVHDKLKRRIKPDSRKDEVAYEKHAKWLKTFQRIYVGLLEKTQNCMEMEEMIKYVTEKMEVSQSFQRIRAVAIRDFQNSKRLLGGNGYVLPGLVDARASLASALYDKFRERQIAHDGLAYITEKIKLQLQQLHGWENMKGTSICNTDVGQGDVEPPLRGSAASHSQQGRAPDSEEDNVRYDLLDTQDSVIAVQSDGIPPLQRDDSLFSQGDDLISLPEDDEAEE